MMNGSDEWIDDWLESAYEDRNGDPIGAGSFDCEEVPFCCRGCGQIELYCECEEYGD